MSKRSIWIGYDPREEDAFAVARHSMHRHVTRPVTINAISLHDVRAKGLYVRPTSRRKNAAGRAQLWDDRSDWWMSTEFAISRFLVGHLAGSGWALFTDCDVLALGDVNRLFDLCEARSEAVFVVKHVHVADGFKMDGQVQSTYLRKNWSSVMLWRVDHPAHGRLTLADINERPGRDLHNFYWLRDDEIGGLPPAWNYLVGHTRLIGDAEPALVHFTDGIPTMPGHADDEFAEVWRAELALAERAACRAA